MITKAKYEELRKKYNLPDFEELDREFEISAIEDKQLNIRETRKKVAERIEKTTGIISEMLEPENIVNIYESKALSEAEREELFNLFKQLMFLKRETQLLEIRNEEKEDAAFINKTLSEWKALKEDLVKLVEKVKSYWKESSETKEELGYLG